jgi:hypothetical protein
MPQLLASVAVTTHAPLHSVWPGGQPAHAPFVQLCPWAQRRPHAPQLAVLLVVFAHWPPHSISPAPHTHIEPTQVRPPVQTTAQAPQLLELVAVFTHAVPHWTVPAGHELTQPAGLHSWPAAHALPHAPQFAMSAVVSTQTPLHRVLPAGQAHWPRVHVVPPAHVTPHAPQFRLSLAKLTHAAPHSDRLFWHVAMQRPRLHTSLAAHATPHAPQLRGSLAVSVQLPAHSTCGSGQLHVPFTQLVPAEQALPQAPQWLFELARFTHAPPQSLSPVSHVLMHRPALHT